MEGYQYGFRGGSGSVAIAVNRWGTSSGQATSAPVVIAPKVGAYNFTPLTDLVERIRSFGTLPGISSDKRL